MANIYCTATHTGKDFFTHQDRNDFYLSGHHGEVWVVGDSSCKECGISSNKKGAAWINRVSGTVKTAAEAQTIVDTAVEEDQATWNALSAEEKLNRPNRPVKYTLP